MNWNAIGAIGDLVSGVGVIVTLAYLAMQIRQNTRQMHRQTMDASQAQYSSYRRAIMSSRELAHLTTFGFANPDQLDAADLERARQAMVESIFQQYNNWDRTRSGDLDLGRETMDAAHAAFVSRVIATRLGRDVWPKLRPMVESEFRDSVDRILANAPQQPEVGR